MPFPQVPEEIREHYGRIYEEVKKANPKWSKERVSKTTWAIIKKMYKKDKNGHWVKKENLSAFLDNDANLAAIVKVYASEDVNTNDNVLGESMKDNELVISRARLANPKEIAFLKQSLSGQTDELKQKMFESAGLDIAADPDKISESDYIYIKSWLCHADKANANRIAFTESDLKDCVRNGNFSPLTPVIVDVNHKIVPCVGFVLMGYLDHDEMADAQGIEVYSVILNWGPYKEAGDKIIAAHQKNELLWSMAAAPEYYQSMKDENIIYKNKMSLIEHEGEERSKWSADFYARHPVFYTNSIILPPYQPADKDAKTTDISDNFNELLYANTEGDKKMDELAKAKADLEEALKQVKALTDQLNEREKTETAQTIEVLKTDLEKSKTDLANVTTESAAKDTKIADLEKTNGELKAKVDAVEKAEADRVKAEHDALVVSRKQAITDLKIADETKVNWFNAKAEMASNEDWDMLLASAKALASAKTQEELDAEREAAEKLAASEALGATTGSGKTGGESPFKTFVNNQVAKNI